MKDKLGPYSPAGFGMDPQIGPAFSLAIQWPAAKHSGRELVRVESTDNVTITGSDITGGFVGIFADDMGTVPGPQITITDNTLDPLADGDALQIFGPGWGAQPISAVFDRAGFGLPPGQGP